MTSHLPLSARVRASRKAKGLSREKLAAATGLNPKTVWSVEKGFRPAAGTINALNDFLALGIEDVGAELAAFDVEATA
jgi:transcriptional regulator with XRE-family HTH domain